MKKKTGKETQRSFARHFGRNLALALGLIFVALWIGVWGYHHFEHMAYVDAFANAAMILSGMGPLTPLVTDAGKIFAGCYALFSGLLFILILGLIFSPVVHRLFLKFKVMTG